MKRWSMFALYLCAGSLSAAEPSQAQVDLSMASAELPALSVAALAEGGAWTVSALTRSSETVVVVLHGAPTGASITLEVAASLVAEAGLVAGSAVSVIATEAGYLIRAGVTVIAFVPSADAEALLHTRVLP